MYNRFVVRIYIYIYIWENIDLNDDDFFDAATYCARGKEV
jgi:hypothetical protein